MRSDGVGINTRHSSDFLDVKLSEVVISVSASFLLLAVSKETEYAL